MRDIVVDTNVLVHANSTQEQEGRQEAAIDLITHLIESNENICLDEGYDFEEAINKSLIFAEYMKFLIPGMLGYQLLTTLLSEARIIELPKNINASASRKINQCVVKSRDRTFLRVTHNSEEKVLVSHDFEDFQKEKRKMLKKELGIIIITAEKAVETCKE